ncbi:Separin [Eumeta japonica]|uniref:separase n=1 Tax=Eumeta variegata TaxID=151549 RepID=A0A4C1ZIZ9_EUMVA|nr:Separin [Eumeta japonica]
MDEFDIFTDEIKFSSPVYMDIVNKFKGCANTEHSGPNYQSSRKLCAEEYLAASDDINATFCLSESVSASLRILAVYREEQIKCTGDRSYKIFNMIRPITELMSKSNDKNVDYDKHIQNEIDAMSNILDNIEIEDTEPLYKRYLKFSPDNNINNFQRVLKDMPREWTIIQITAPYNPNENLKPYTEYREEIFSLYVSVMTNSYFDENIEPFTVQVPANVVREGEKPLFMELYSVLDDNYKSISVAPRLANRRLIQSYWDKREEVDLRMKSVINIMDKEWLGSWKCLFMGKLIDTSLTDKIKALVDKTISDWGLLSEVCLKCLSKCFQAIHHFTVVDGIKAFSETAKQIRESDEWIPLKTAKRHPVILIIDECETSIRAVHWSKTKTFQNSGDGWFLPTPSTPSAVQKNLDRMEKRMSAFVQYWCPDWRGELSKPPEPDIFLRYLEEADIFLYCGHGDGCQFACGGAGNAGVESVCGRAAALLSGCGSVRLAHAGGRAPPAAAHHHYHIAGSPMVVGMLWEVTDLEVDKVVSTAALCVPTSAPLPWESVGKAQWSNGVLDTNTEAKTPMQTEQRLRAVAKARDPPAL